MHYLTALILLSLSNIPYSLAQSTLLDNVKRNPEEAIALCEQFRSLNNEGIPAGSKEAIMKVSRQRNISQIEAEILMTYVIGINCPDVRFGGN